MNQLRVMLHSITIVLIQIGIFAWYQIANFDNEKWINLYYVWDKVVNVLLVCCILLKPPKTIVPFWVLIGTFFVFRCLLEITQLYNSMNWLMRYLTEYHIMFLINLICIAAVYIIYRRRCQK